MMNKRTIIMMLFLLTLLLGAINLSAAPIGQGSYTTTLPAGKNGPVNSAGTAVTPKVVSGFSGPVTTNDWWSSLIWQHDPTNPYSESMFPHPWSLSADATGLGGTYSTYVALNNEYHMHFQPEDIHIGLVGLNAASTQVVDYSDWAVTARWSGGGSSMDATIGHGLPYVYVTKSGGDALISVTTGYEGTWYNSNGVLGIQANGHYYAIFAPSGSTWTGSNPFQSSLNGQDYFSVAVLPDNSTATLEFYRQHAYAFVTDTEVSWQYDQATANLSSTYTASTQLMESGNGTVNTPLQALYRHQWMHSSDSLTSYTYESPRGEMKVRAGNSFSTNMPFSGVLPSLPDEGNYSQSQLYSYVDEVYNEILATPLDPTADTYWGGKAAGRLAALVRIAEQVGHTAARDLFLAQLQTRLEDWLDSDGGNSLFYYDTTWDTLIGFPESFNSNGELNDHDFHYGYWLMAAATVAQYNPTWANESQWGGMVEMVIKDVANWERSDTMFPFLRSFDPYAGHDWANGPALFASGNNEESSSEAMNFATAVILWGAATNNTDIRDMGIYLYTTMSEAIDQYWFDVDEVVFPTGYDYETVGMVWSNGGAYATWWTANPEEIHGINFLPITGGSLYLGHHPNYVSRNYDFLVNQNGGTETEWVDIIWSFQALDDPAAALAKFGSGNYTPEAGESKAHTYHWLHNLNAMGQVDTSVTADTPTYAVFNDGGTRTYVAYNPGSSTITVNFSDGRCLQNIAPNELASGAGSTNCGGSNPTATPTNTSVPSGQAPYGGTAWSVPGRIEAEDYDTGGEGVAYHDTGSGNNGNAYRSDDVDVQGTNDTGGGYNVGWIANGEWLEYSVNVASSATYDVDVRVASLNAGGTLHIEVDGVDVTGPMSFNATNGWQNWTTISADNIPLSAGSHIIRVAMDSNNFNVNWMEWSTTAVSPTATPTTQPPTATPTTQPPTATPTTQPPTATPTSPPASGTNVALNQPATQSSTAYGGVPARAVDGNTNGNWNQGSVTHTSTEAQPWWEVDLGSGHDISNIVLFNRTNNCCTHRLADFYVYVSDSSFGTRTDVAQMANEANWSTYHSGTLSGSSIDIAANTNGRYVRVQLSGTTNPLSLAEVQVYGTQSSNGDTFSGSGSGGSYAGDISYDNGVVTIRAQANPAATNILIYPTPPGGGYFMSYDAGADMFVHQISGLSSGTEISFYLVIQNPTQWQPGITHTWTVP